MAGEEKGIKQYNCGLQCHILINETYRSECSEFYQVNIQKGNTDILNDFTNWLLTRASKFFSPEISVEYFSTRHHLEVGLILHSADQQIKA